MNTTDLTEDQKAFLRPMRDMRMEVSMKAMQCQRSIQADSADTIPTLEWCRVSPTIASCEAIADCIAKAPTSGTPEEIIDFIHGYASGLRLAVADLDHLLRQLNEAKQEAKKHNGNET